MNKIFKKLYEPLVSFIEEIISDREEAESMAVEIFTGYWGEIKRYEEVEDITEIRQVLLKKALMESFIFLKKRIEQQEAVAIFLQKSQDFEFSEKEAKIEEKLRQLLEDGGGELTIIQNNVLRLFFGDVRSPEAAEIMDITPSTFRNTKRAVLKKIRKILEDGGFIVIIILLILSAKALPPVTKSDKIKPSKIFNIKSWKNLK